MDGINLIPTGGMGAGGSAAAGGLAGGLLGGLLFGNGGLNGGLGRGVGAAVGDGVTTGIILDQINANSAQLDTLSAAQLNIANQSNATLLKSSCDTQMMLGQQANALAASMAQFNAGTNLAMCENSHRASDDISSLSSSIALANAAMAREMAECCCTTQRSIDAVNFQSIQNTCAITGAIRDDGAATRALINANTMQDLRDQLCDAKSVIATQNANAFTTASQAAQSDLLIKHMQYIAAASAPAPSK